MDEKFQTTWKKLNLSYDKFIRTSTPAHHRACQEIFRRLRKNDDIYKALYQGLYCKGCEERKKETDLVNGKCPNHPTLELTKMAEENYFFRLSKYAAPVKKLIEAGGFIDPAFRANEMLQVIEQGLEDISISRRATKWGVPIPDDPDQVMYVWFDALINYITAAGFPDEPDRFAKQWPADVHVIGKDITRFHAVIWPAMLMSAGIPLPRKLAIHGFVNFQGAKMSKTLGTAIYPDVIADRWGADALRSYLVGEVAFGYDGDFTWETFFQKSNANLGDNLGNLLNRIVAAKYFNGEFASKGTPLPQDAVLREKVGTLADRIEPLMERNEFHTALAEIWEAARATNGHIEALAPWKLAKQGKTEEVAGVLYQAAEALRIIAVLLSPFIPASSRRI